MKKIIGVIIVAILMHLVSVLFMEDVTRINFVFVLYLLSTISLFGLGYFETVNIEKLGFGITRKTIFRTYTKNLFIVIGILFLFSVYNAFVYKLVYKNQSFWELLNLGMLIYYSIIIFSFGQIGVLFGNIRINKIVGSILFFLLLTTNLLFALLFNRFLIVNIILLALGAGLIFVNYVLIEKSRI